MNGHFDLYGVFLPTLLILLLGAYVLKSLLRVLLTRLGFYRFVWHPPLFNLALYILILGLLFNFVPGL
ncbi:MAG TPA: DUF1656 domain-containing protein [Pseudomonas sp.]|nr:DUF1656 domain-containing protein [Pseudomonas sp.]